MARTTSIGKTMKEYQPKIVTLEKPELCESCRFAKQADVKIEGETPKRMIHCIRLDCDNWIITPQPNIQEVFDIPE